LICGALLFSITLSAASALAQEEAKAAPKAQSGGDMGEIGHKLAGHFIIGGGPVGLFPTATDDDLGKDQWALGPAVVFATRPRS